MTPKTALITGYGTYTPTYNLVGIMSALEKRGVVTRYVDTRTESLSTYGVPDVAYIPRELSVDLVAPMERLQEAGTFFINPPRESAEAADKLILSQKLTAAGISTPKTIEVNNDTDFNALPLTWPIVIKPTLAYSGVNVILCYTPLQAQIATRKVLADNNPNHYFFVTCRAIAQEYVKDYHNVVLSFIVTGDNITGKMDVAHHTADRFKSTHRKGRAHIPMNIPNDLRDFLLNLHTTLGVSATRTELYYTPNGYSVAEVNVPGGRMAMDGILGIEHHEMTADLIISRYQSR